MLACGQAAAEAMAPCRALAGSFPNWGGHPWGGRPGVDRRSSGPCTLQEACRAPEGRPAGRTVVVRRA